MKTETRAVKIYTREDSPGISVGSSLVIEIDGVEIPLIESIKIEDIHSGDVVTATIKLLVRLGK